jgi:hypothetical protein
MVMWLLATLHRWWGVAFCLLFAMWFASGIVMHFVTFPSRSEQSQVEGIDMSRAHIERIDYDQWTVAGEFNGDRPLTRISLDDEPGTQIYISSGSGKVVLTTTQNHRLLNYFGSIPHWIYFKALRHHPIVWGELVWLLSLLATIGAAIGAIVGVVCLWVGGAYQGLRRWHHLFGLIFAPVIIAWIFSGFLSVDDGWLLPRSDKLFRQLHTLDFPLLAAHPSLRTTAIVGLCLCGLMFSLIGVVLAWRVSWSLTKNRRGSRPKR